MALTTLYRPVGQREYELIAQSGFREFPPRLPEQPIFYPVTNEDYAVQIAWDWNTRDEASGNVGYVLSFQVDSTFLQRYPLRTVGAGTHTEYWIPSEELATFNQHIEGVIETLARYTSPLTAPDSSAD